MKHIKYLLFALLGLQLIGTFMFSFSPATTKFALAENTPSTSPSSQPPKIISFTASPTNASGYTVITAGQTVRLSWQINNFGAQNTNVWLVDFRYKPTPGQYWRKDHLPLQGSLQVTPLVPTQYALWANTPSLGGISDMRNVMVYIQSGPSGNPGGTHTTTYAFYLNRYPIAGSGPIPYGNTFPLPGESINGNLKQITNPNWFRIGLVLPGYTTNDCFSTPKATIVLGSGMSTTSANMKALYGNSDPKLPVGIVACIEAGAVNYPSIRVDVTYSYKD